MKKKFISHILIFFYYSNILARQILAPLPYIFGYNTQFFSQIKIHQDWLINCSITPYYKTANNAFDSKGNKSDIAKLFFSKSSFSASDAFCTNNPNYKYIFKNNSKFSPSIKYKEYGALFCLDFAKQINNWKLGLRTLLSIKKLKINSKNRLPTILGLNYNNNAIISPNGYAYNLRFLTNTTYGKEYPQNLYSIVNYYDTSFPGNPITIYNQNITNRLNNPVSAVYTRNGKLPNIVNATQNIINTMANVEDDGRISNNSNQGKFLDDINYMPLLNNINRQNDLWIIPTIENNGQFSQASRVIKNEVTQIYNLPTFSSNPNLSIPFKFDFSSCQRHGIGDFDTEIFLGYYFNEYFYLEADFGIRFPTASKIKNVYNVFCQPLGNNGHYAYTFALEGLLETSNWLTITSQVRFLSTLKAKEYVAAPFVCNNIKNIGPSIIADISWKEVFYELDTISNIYNNCYLDIGYKLYYKSNDNIDLKEKSIENYLSINTYLNPSILSSNSKIINHELRFELLYNLNLLDLFLGSNITVGGQNTTSNREFHTGLSLYF